MEVLTVRGALKLAYFTWREEPNQAVIDVVKRYCKYLALHGYGMEAEEIFHSLQSKNEDEAMNWLNYTYSEFVLNDSDMMSFVYGL